MSIRYQFSPSVNSGCKCLKGAKCREEIEGLWNKGTYSQNRWVVFSPSYCLPTWFENFYNSLMDHDKEYLRNIDPNNITEQDKAGLLVLLVEYKKLLKRGL